MTEILYQVIALSIRSLLFLGAICSLPAGAVQPTDTRADRLAGNLTSTGSDSLNALMQAWAARFMVLHPELNVQIQAGGSATAAVALAESAANLGPMSRPMTAAEIQRFYQVHQYPPLEIPVALETLAVFVHRSNPLQYISLAELEQLYSAEPQCRSVPMKTHWEQLGVEGRLRHRVISLYGRNSASGTYGFLRQQLLCNGDFRAELHELPGAAAVIQAVALSANGIGITGAQHAAAGVKRLTILDEAGGTPVDLQRTLYIYLNQHPLYGVAVAERSFLQMVLSDDGQQLAMQHGYEPLPTQQRAALLALLNGSAHDQ